MSLSFTVVPLSYQCKLLTFSGLLYLLTPPLLIANGYVAVTSVRQKLFGRHRGYDEEHKLFSVFEYIGKDGVNRMLWDVFQHVAANNAVKLLLRGRGELR